MKQLVLVTAIAAVCAAPMAAMAGNTVYGSLSYSVNSVDQDTATGQDGLSGEDNVSLLGIKGSIGDDIKAFYHLQTGAPSDANGGRAFNQRFYFGGLSGSFGKVAYGRMTNAYKFAGFAMDPFYNLSHVNAGGSVAFGGATYGLSPATNGFTDNALQYTSPSLGGNFKLNASVYIDDGNDDEHGFNAGGHWTADDFNVGVQFASNGKNSTVPNVAADGDAVRVYGGYKADKWSVGVSYESVDLSTTFEDVGYLYITGRIKLTPKTELIGSIGSVDDGPAEGTGFIGGVFHTIAPKTEIYATYSTASIEPAPSVGAEKDPSVFAIGARHKFSFGGS
ncbi:MAG: porin [Candidatus Thiodiazotropha sp. (ex Monitilora ramsayi)]|nr:porin [Candidatus Thiodiazotropha sp. (ex Monitilora ramsayi)]